MMHFDRQLRRARHAERRGAWLEAMQAYLTLYQAARRERAESYMDRALFGLSDLLAERMGEYSFALKILGQIFRENLPRTRARLFARGLRILRLSGHIRRAPDYVRAGLAYAHKERLNRPRIQILQEAGLLLLERQRLDVAGHFLGSALRLAQKERDASLSTRLRADLALVLDRKGQHGLARKLMGRALRAGFELDRDDLLAYLYLRQALLDGEPWLSLGKKLARRHRLRALLHEYERLSPLFRSPLPLSE